MNEMRCWSMRLGLSDKVEDEGMSCKAWHLRCQPNCGAWKSKVVWNKKD